MIYKIKRKNEFAKNRHGYDCQSLDGRFYFRNLRNGDEIVKFGEDGSESHFAIVKMIAKPCPTCGEIATGTPFAKWFYCGNCYENLIFDSDGNIAIDKLPF